MVCFVKREGPKKSSYALKVRSRKKEKGGGSASQKPD